MLGWLFKDTHFVCLEVLTMLVNNTANISLINPDIVVCHAFLLNIYEYPKYHQH